MIVYQDLFSSSNFILFQHPLLPKITEVHMEVSSTKLDLWFFSKLLRYFWYVNSSFSCSLPFFNKTKEKKLKCRNLIFQGRRVFTKGIFHGGGAGVFSVVVISRGVFSERSIFQGRG